ncbi:MAG TPA: hypothetical protein VGI64_04165 [Streptosporangiaceae bacterium]
MRVIKPALAAAGVCATVIAGATPAALAAPAAGAGPDRQAAAARLAARVIGGAGSASVAPDPARPGQIVEFSINCGSPGSATLSGAGLGLAARIPMRSSGGAVTGLFFADVTLPAALHAGTYHPEMACGNGVAGTASLRVTTTPAGGGVATGDGTTSTATDHGLQLLGLSILGLGAITGAVALRRRRNG